MTADEIRKMAHDSTEAMRDLVLLANTENESLEITLKRMLCQFIATQVPIQAEIAAQLAELNAFLKQPYALKVSTSR